MAKGNDTTRAPAVGGTEPLDAAEVQHRIELARRLVALAAEQTRQSLLNLDLARTGLAEIETDLAIRGLKTGGVQ